MAALSAADFATALQRLQAVTPESVTEVITNPKDLNNDLAIIVDVLKIASVFFPEIGVILTVASAIETFLPEIEEGVVFLETFGALANIHIKPDADPEIDAQLQVNRDKPIL